MPSLNPTSSYPNSQISMPFQHKPLAQFPSADFKPPTVAGFDYQQQSQITLMPFDQLNKRNQKTILKALSQNEKVVSSSTTTAKYCKQDEQGCGE